MQKFMWSIQDIDNRQAWGVIPKPPIGRTWDELMDIALTSAKNNCGEEVPVGAIIVKYDGQIIADAKNKSIEKSDPTAHAEICAIRQASAKLGNYRLNNCVMVVTLEPCIMCVGAMIHARLSGVVYGAYSLKSGAVESCINGFDLPYLNHRVWHYGGVRSDECASFLKLFFQKKR